MHTTYFNIDILSLVMICLVSFIGLCVASFSINYLKGDRAQGKFYCFLTLMVLSVCIMVSTDHLLILLISWACSNYLLSRLMLHKKTWQAARNSSRLAMRNFLLGTIFLAAAFIYLYLITGTSYISQINSSTIPVAHRTAAGISIVLCAMTQSGIFPFHRWLLSSLNSPTPVSAIMHAGLINGGGFLLARFGHIFAGQDVLLNIIFTVGILSATTGILWKLIQNDVKRMLACSTMSQMGYMIAQCGLGLFPAAVAHLCWHGLFKAYLFLASGTAAQDHRLIADTPLSWLHVPAVAVCGFLSTYIFSITTGLNIFNGDTTIFILFVIFISGTQMAITTVRQEILGKYSIAIIASTLAGYTYGISVNLFDHIMAPLNLYQPQPVNILHISAMMVLTLIWLAIHSIEKQKNIVYPKWMLALYVKMLNASQPHPKTVTAYRNAYQF